MPLSIMSKFQGNVYFIFFMSIAAKFSFHMIIGHDHPHHNQAFVSILLCSLKEGAPTNIA